MTGLVLDFKIETEVSAPTIRIPATHGRRGLKPVIGGIWGHTEPAGIHHDQGTVRH